MHIAGLYRYPRKRLQRCQGRAPKVQDARHVPCAPAPPFPLRHYSLLLDVSATGLESRALYHRIGSENTAFSFGNLPRFNANQGVKFSGSGGSSRISVMVTRRFGDIYGSSGNRGSVSALPPTMKTLPDGTPSASRI